MSFYLQQANLLAQQQHEVPVRQSEVKMDDHYPFLPYTPEEIELLISSTLGGNLEPSFDVIREYRAQQRHMKGIDGSQLALTAPSPTVSTDWTRLAFPRTPELSASDAVNPPTKYQDVKQRDPKARPSLPRYPDCACVRDDGGQEIVPETYRGDRFVVVKDYYTSRTIYPHLLWPQAAKARLPPATQPLHGNGASQPRARGAQAIVADGQQGVKMAQQRPLDGQSLPAGSEQNRMRYVQTPLDIEPVPSGGLSTAFGDQSSALSGQTPEDADRLPANGQPMPSSDLLASRGRQYWALPGETPQNDYTKPAPGYPVPSGDLSTPLGGQYIALDSFQAPVSGQRLCLSGQQTSQNEPPEPRRRGRPRKDPSITEKLPYTRRKKPDEDGGAEQPRKKPKTATTGAKSKPSGVGDTIVAASGAAASRANKFTPPDTPPEAFARAQETPALPDGAHGLEDLAPLFQ